MNAGLEDTIAAIATAPGRAGTALIRISGPDATGVAEALGVTGLDARETAVRLVHHPDGRALDRAVVVRYVAPSSYTGEDTVEISTHGGVLVPQLVLDAACAAGARPALPGEFTRRAYLNGKLDLVQVEATQDLIEATSPAHHAAAVHQLDGALSRRVDALRDGLVELRALIAYDIDFPEEDDGPVGRRRVVEAASAFREGMRRMLALAPEGERLRDGVLVVMVGAPNAGKSSIFNSLLGSQRAIVTDIPGTTRDAIEAEASIQGFPFRFVDTAGVRDQAGEVEAIGIEVARRYLAQADTVLLCVEAGRAWTDAERRLEAEVKELGATLIALRTKTDLHAEESEMREESEVREGAGSGASELGVSALTGDGLDALRVRLVEASFAGLRDRGEPPLVTRARQTRALTRADAAVAAFAAALEEGLPAEIADTHLADAALALEEVVGATDIEDVLGAIFSTFCVGK